VFLEGFDPEKLSDRHRTRRARGFLLTMSLAAAAAIIALAVTLSSANNHVANLEQALAGNGHNGVASALATPGHKVVTLSSTSHQVLASLVLLPDGRGYLVKSNMPTLPSSETYQLWGIVNGSPVSIGIMGSTPRAVGFTIATSPAPTKIGVTIEPAGGSLTPTNGMVASGVV
jgi:anti-sigma-K factor RskA